MTIDPTPYPRIIIAPGNAMSARVNVYLSGPGDYWPLTIPEARRMKAALQATECVDWPDQGIFAPWQENLECCFDVLITVMDRNGIRVQIYDGAVWIFFDRPKQVMLAPSWQRMTEEVQTVADVIDQLREAIDAEEQAIAEGSYGC